MALIGAIRGEVTLDQRPLIRSSDDTARRLLQLQNTANQRFRQMDDISRRHVNAMSKHQLGFRQALTGSTAAFAGFARGALGAVLPILSAGAAVAKARAGMEEFSRLGETADMLGLNVEVLQELRFAANSAGMSSDNLELAFRRMARRAAEAAQGTGAAKKAFEELGISVTNTDGRLKDSRELLGEVADALQRVPNQADKLRLAFSIFDTDGAKMLNVLADGSAGLDEFARQARAAGLVIDASLIQRTREVKTEFDTATRAIDLQFKATLVALGPILTWAAQQAAGLALAIRDIGDAIHYWSGSLDLVSADNLDQLHRNLGAERVRLEGEILELESRMREIDRAALADPSMAVAKWDINVQLEERRDRLAEIADEESRINKILLERPEISSPTVPDIDFDTEITNRNRAAESAIKQADTIKAVIERLEHERATIGVTGAALRAMNELRAAGIDATHEQASAIVSLVEEIEKEKAAVADAQRVQQEYLNTLERGLANAFMSIVDGSKSAGEAVADLLKQLGQLAINNAFKMMFAGATPGATSGGLLGGAIIPGILHGGGVAGADGYSHGRAFSPSIWAGAERYHSGGVAGLRANEVPAILEKGEIVLPRRALENLNIPSLPQVSGGGRSGPIEITVKIDGARGNREIEEAVSAGVSTALNQYDQSLARKVERKVYQMQHDPRTPDGSW